MTGSSARVLERRRSPGGPAGGSTERRGLIAELQRRNVIRMAGLYLVAAWLITQVSATVLPLFEAPPWVPRSVVVLLALAFVPTLIFSWVFELTPEGIRRDSEIAPEHSIAPLTGRKMDRMIIAVLALALAYFCFDRLVLEPRRGAALVAATTQNLKAAAKAATPKPSDRNSIAVLPFVNMSGDAANEYFSDGVSEEILNVLARTPELKVAARTSSFSFKGRPVEVPAIARELDVRMVLEGSVRKQGDRVRITAQLIDAQNGFQVWSQTFDRKLDDIFAIQDEIAKAIGEELMVKIVAATNPRKASEPRNLAAYDLYLRGMALWNTRRGEDLWTAIELFGKAVALDPEFAEAYAGRALAYTVLPAYSSRLSWAEALARADESALHALALDPGLPEPYVALANTLMTRLQRSTADALFQRAIALRPSFATAHQWRANVQLTSGDLEGSLASIERSSALDPRSAVIADNHAFTLLALGRPQDASARCAQVLEFTTGYAGCLQYTGMAALLSGDLPKAQAMLDRHATANNASAAAQGRELVDALAGRADRRALATRMAALPFNSLVDATSGNALEDPMVATAIVLLGEPALALDYIERTAGNLGNYMDWAIMLPVMDPIRCEPRFVAVVSKLETRDPRRDDVCAAKR